MRILIIGGGGREHALAWKLAQSSAASRIFCAPGNAGIAGAARCIDLPVTDSAALLEFALEEKIDLTVVGPEAPLAAGLADDFRLAGLRVFGPGRAGARLEWSKVWAKEAMVRWGIPTAAFAVFDDYESARRHLEKSYGGRAVVVKADGLAAGKGVTVAHDSASAEGALRAAMIEGAFGDAGAQVLLEDCLYGEELSMIAITDGQSLVILPPSQDHKALGEGDSGPNTGGMGAYSPVPLLTEELAHEIKRSVFQPFLRGLEMEGIDYRGVIYAGLMISGRELKVLEFNVRFGDPETQVLLPLLRCDLLPLLLAASEGRLAGAVQKAEAAAGGELHRCSDAAACVVLASGGYPGPYESGKLISGLGGLEEAASAPPLSAAAGGQALFHAGTAFDDDGRIVTAGGRVIGVTAWAAELRTALERAYGAAELIDFEGRYFRRDIGRRALGR